MTFIASLSSVEALAEEFKFIRDMIEAFPFIGTLLGVLAPLFVKIVNALLPVILEVFSMLEGPVSSSVVEASLFTKLAAFMIIQTFFVSAISGGLLQEISKIINNPSYIIEILAVSLPSQVCFSWVCHVLICTMMCRFFRSLATVNHFSFQMYSRPISFRLFSLEQ